MAESIPQKSQVTYGSLDGSCCCRSVQCDGATESATRGSHWSFCFQNSGIALSMGEDPAAGRC